MKMADPLETPTKGIAGKRDKWRKLFCKRITRKYSHLSEASETTARYEPETPPTHLLPEDDRQNSDLFDFSYVEE
jgi:hypothetical protein